MFQRQTVLIDGKATTLITSITQQKKLLYFIPGNPGAVDFYGDFLSFIDIDNIDVIAASHIGHNEVATTAVYSLEDQIEHHRKSLALLGKGYDEVVICGHSVGALIAIQLKAAQHVLLFPTLQHIASTPNGIKLSWLFHPASRLLVSFIALVLSWIPQFLLSQLVTKLTGMSPQEAGIVASVVIKRHFAANALYMAATEMSDIKELQVDLLKQLNFVAYFGRTDAWAPISHYKQMSGMFNHVYLDKLGMSHSFTLDADKGEALAQMFKDWL